MESSNKKIAINTILNAFRLSLTILVPLITFPYTSRIFSADGTGQVEWVKSTINVFILIAQLGIYTYAVREGVKLRNDRKAFSKFAQELLIINGMATILSYAILLICIVAVPKFGQYRLFLAVYSVNIIMSALGLDWVYGVYEEYKYITIRQILVQLFSLVCLFTFVHNKSDVIIYLIITTVSLSGANIFNVIRARKYISFRAQHNYNIKKHTKPVIIFFATKIAANAYNYIDNVMLGLLSSEVAVGLYSAGVKINAILITFFTAMGPVYLPKLVECVKRNDEHEFDSFIKKVVKLKFMIAIPIAVGMIMLSKPLISIIAGKDFLDASDTLRILSCVFILVIFSNIIQNDILVPLGKEQIVFKITVVGAVVNICVNSIMICFFADKGAAIGSVIAELMALTIGLYEIKKLNINALRGFLKDIKNYIIASGAIGIVCYLICIFVNNIVLQVVITIPVVVITYFLILMLFRDEMILLAAKMIKLKLDKH